MKINANISKMDIIYFHFALLIKSRSTYVTVLIFASLLFGFICWKNGVPKTTNNWMAALVAP
jgi:hypothetical protein